MKVNKFLSNNSIKLLFFLLFIIIIFTFFIVKQTLFTPNKVIISRPNDPIDHLAAFQKVIADQTQINKLYKDIYALPKMPSGEYHCPLEVFVRYNIDFYNNNNLVVHILVNPTGCREVKIGDFDGRWDINKETVNKDLQQILNFSRKEYYGEQYMRH